MFNFILKLFLIVSPVLYLPNIALNIMDMGVFRVFMISLFTASYFKEPIRNFPKNNLIFLFLILGIFSCIAHLFNAVDTSHFTNMFLGALGIITIYCHVSRPEKFYKYIIMGLILNLYLYLLQVSGFNLFESLKVPDENAHGVWGAFFGITPRLNTYMALCLPFIFFIPKTKEIYRVFLFLTVLMACLLVEHKEIMIFIISAVMLIAMQKDKYQFQCSHIIIPILIIGGLFLDYQINATGLTHKIVASVNLRLSNFDINLASWRAYPVVLSLIGYGISYPRGVAALAVNQDPTLLSDHFQISLCLGIFGIIFMIYAWYKFFKSFDSNKPEDLFLLILFLLMFVEYPFQIARIWHLIVITLAFKLIKHERVS